jgi:hypothetical protein
LLILNYINPKPFYYDTVPVKPVHGQVRNRLYFDSHAEAERVDW